LAPNWMEFNKKYYTFDYHYFYDDFVKMGQDIFKNEHELSVNKDTPYINIYSFLNVFKPGAYTIDEMYEYVDYRIDDSQNSKSACEVSLLTNHLPTQWELDNQGGWTTCNHIMRPPFANQKETFRTWEGESGINPAILIAISEGESGFGRSQESHEDGDPFNFGNPYNNNCDFCCNPKKCIMTLGPTICDDCCNKCPSDKTDQELMTPYIIRTWPLFWKDQVSTGKKDYPIFGLKGGGIAQGYNPSMYWGPHMAAKYYKMDLWLGFCEKKRINSMSNPASDDTFFFINPAMKNSTFIKANSDIGSNPCSKTYP